MTLDLHNGDCLEVLASMPDACVDAVVTDPPYGLSFMGKGWDYQVPSVEIWEQCLRVLKPGGHLLAFAGTRTQHRMCVNIEDAGFEIRDMIAWLYGSGFPKSMNVGKAIAAQRLTGGCSPQSLRRARLGEAYKPTGQVDYQKGRMFSSEIDSDSAIAPVDSEWGGWGTALKPALEPITVARKPFSGTVAANVLEHGTGAINIDGCRVGTTRRTPASLSTCKTKNAYGEYGGGAEKELDPNIGRWPANLIHDGSDEVTQPLNDSARFFYTAKASKDDRDKGNTHPTVKPTDLMAYLCRLVTPPGGIVLDPFMGSGTTGKAALSEGFSFVGIERDPDYYAICESRFNGAQIGLALTV